MLDVPVQQVSARPPSNLRCTIPVSDSKSAITLTAQCYTSRGNHMQVSVELGWICGLPVTCKQLPPSGTQMCIAADPGRASIHTPDQVTQAAATPTCNIWAVQPVTPSRLLWLVLVERWNTSAAMQRSLLNWLCICGELPPPSMSKSRQSRLSAVAILGWHVGV